MFDIIRPVRLRSGRWPERRRSASRAPPPQIGPAVMTTPPWGGGLVVVEVVEMTPAVGTAHFSVCLYGCTAKSGLVVLTFVPVDVFPDVDVVQEVTIRI